MEVTLRNTQLFQGSTMQKFAERRKKDIPPEEHFKYRMKNLLTGVVIGIILIAFLFLLIRYT